MLGLENALKVAVRHPHSLCLEGFDTAEAARVKVDAGRSVISSLVQARRGLVLLVRRPPEFCQCLPLKNAYPHLLLIREREEPSKQCGASPALFPHSSSATIPRHVRLKAF